jgi:TRAP-type C4-dicarboxylate transport system substrate-binding protein
MKGRKLLTLVCGLLFSACAVQAEEIEITAISSFSANLEFAKDLQVFIGDVNERGRGLVRIRYVGGHEVIPQRQQVYALRRGVIDLSFAASTYLIGVAPEGDAFLGATITPFEARENGAYDAIQEIWAEKLNSFFLGWHQTGYRLHIFLRTPPDYREDGLPDVRGLRIRTSPTYRPFLKALGATPVDITSSEVYTALERGTVDAMAWTGVSMSNEGFQHFVKYRLEPGVLNAVMTMQMNLDSWNALPPNVQAFLLTESMIYERKSRERFFEIARQERISLARDGMSSVDLPAGVAESYKQLATDAVWGRMGTRAPESVARLRPLFDPGFDPQ